MTDYLNHLNMLPEHMQGAVQRYIEHGIRGGSFLDAVVRHELFDAVAHADIENRNRLTDYVQFFYNYAPGGCHGSDERVNEWIARGGVKGRTDYEQ